MKKKEMTLKEKKEMAKLWGISLDTLEQLLDSEREPSTSDSLFQNIRETEDAALSSIHMRLFRQETISRNDDEAE